MPTYTEEIKIRRWVGTAVDLASVGLAAAEAVETWGGGRREARASMDVKFRGGGTVDLVLPADMEQVKVLGTHRSLKEATIRTGNGYSPPSVEIRAEDFLIDPAVKVRIIGTSEADVHWLSEQLKKALSSGQGRPQWYRRMLLAPLALVFGVMLEIGILSSRLLETAVGAGGLLLVLGLMAVTPNLELLGPHEKTRWRRFARPLLLAVATIVLGIVGTAIYERFA